MSKLVRESIFEGPSQDELIKKIDDLEPKEINEHFLRRLIIRGLNDALKYIFENKELHIFQLEKALEHCVDYNNEAMLEYLIEYIQGIDQASLKDGIIEAAERGNAEYLEIFRSKGADIHLNNEAPLMYAVERGKYDAVKLLIDDGANVNAKSGTALRAAVRGNRPEIAELLMKNGMKDKYVQEVYQRYKVHLHYDRGGNYEHDYSKMNEIFKNYFEGEYE